MLYSEDATSVTSTMLRLISPFGESDGRCVHASDCLDSFVKVGFTFKSSFIYRFIYKFRFLGGGCNP